MRNKKCKNPRYCIFCLKSWGKNPRFYHFHIKKWGATGLPWIDGRQPLGISLHKPQIIDLWQTKRMGNHIVTPTIFCFLLQIVGFCPTFLKCFGQIVGAWHNIIDMGTVRLTGSSSINEKLSLRRQSPLWWYDKCRHSVRKIKKKTRVAGWIYTKATRAAKAIISQV